MTAVDTSMLAAMRAAILDLMPDTCNVVSLTHTSDGQGGWTDTRATVGTSIVCRLDALQGKEVQTGGAVQPYMTYMLSLPYDTAVLPAYVIEHGGANYAVKTVNRGQSWSAVVRVELERI